jgi:Uma2 family endonuclease
MASQSPTPARFTVTEYLQLEAGAKVRHEFRDGEIVAMAGGSPEHSLIIANIIRELGNRLKGKPCRVYDSNLRVRIPRTPLYTYPDVSVICGETQVDPQDPGRTTATNPRLIVEVLSNSTEADDRGEKFRRYLSLESLEEYVLVSQVRARVETFTRQGDGSWRFATAAELESRAVFSSLQVELPLSEIYAGVQFPPEEPQLQLF